MQTTINKPVSCYGIGVHSGQITHLTLKPAKENTGVVFVRTDVSEHINFIDSSYINVSETSLSTEVKNIHNVRVSTIEHLMAALWGTNIDNVIVELDGEEVPIMDGSSKPFVFMIECTGRKLQNAPKKYLKILKEIEVNSNGSQIFAEPGDSLNIDLTINFDNNIIGRQNLKFNNQNAFAGDIAAARTFGFVHELDYLKNKGKAKGASLDNAIGVDQNLDAILNPEGLRYKDEFVRHKILDQIGDLFTCGGRIMGSIKSYKTSHAMNNQFLKELFSNPNNYRWV
jgi:UDP-3-O-[3-hydroxymyristoyl] N-acetylglucosamine deacetylase